MPYTGSYGAELSHGTGACTNKPGSATSLLYVFFLEMRTTDQGLQGALLEILDEVILDEETAADDEDDGEEPAGELWCSGDAPGSLQQHNFEGLWTLMTEVINGQPGYSHQTPDATMVYLFFVESTSAGPAPRWVIGPEPGSGVIVNGWAYADSEAVRPEDVFEPWSSWVKDTSEWGEARLAFKAKGSGIAADVDESGAEDEAAQGHALSASDSNVKKRKGGKKKTSVAAKGSPGKLKGPSSKPKPRVK